MLFCLKLLSTHKFHQYNKIAKEERDEKGEWKETFRSQTYFLLRITVSRSETKTLFGITNHLMIWKPEPRRTPDKRLVVASNSVNSISISMILIGHQFYGKSHKSRHPFWCYKLILGERDLCSKFRVADGTHLYFQQSHCRSCHNSYSLLVVIHSIFHFCLTLEIKFR
jgi:hypothetical protein